MSIKRKYIIGITNDVYIPQFESVIHKYAVRFKASSSHMFFAKQPVDSSGISQEVIFFNMESKSEKMLDKKVNDLISELNELKSEYVLRDEQTGELLVRVGHGAQILIRLDNLKTIKKGTFKKIDDLKNLNTEWGYCKGFKPNFRPIEGNDIENIDVEPELIYFSSDSDENLLKLGDYLKGKIREIDPDLEVEFSRF